MKITVNFSIFRDAFVNSGRSGQFSADALEILFDHLEAIEDERNESELDVVAICCDYSEETVEDLVQIYDVEVGEGEDAKQCVIEFLEDAGAFVGSTEHGTIVFWNQ